MAKPKCTCTICGSQFTGRKHKANLYCGMPCYRAAQRRGDYKRGTKRVAPCSYCGRDVHGRSKSRCRDGRSADNLFCNRACYDKHRATVRASLRRPCGQCGEEFQPSSTTTKYCSWGCRSEAKRAKPTHCVNCGCWFTALKVMRRENRIEMAGVNAAKTCSQACEYAWRSNNVDRREKISKAFTGSKHPNWQGGPQLKYRGARGAGWQRARRAALKRDKHTCQDCGMTEVEHVERTGKGLEVHHKRPFWQFNGDNAKANALSNLVSLCKSCHQKADWAYRKANPVQMGLTIT